MESEVKLTKLADCAGCGAKVGAGTLAELLGDLKVRHDPDLLVGFDRSDDAAAYRVSDELAIVETVDFFPPLVDDPYTFGQIAATNALSDIYAMGAQPKIALNLLAIPKSMPKSAVHALLKGGYDKVYEAGAVIAGGHSIYSDEPKYGLCVTGYVHPDKILKNCGAEEGDALILTKPLGIGILMTALKGEILDEELYRWAVKSMTTLNNHDLSDFRVHACTDVTGFSLMGHMLEVMQGSSMQAEIEVERIDIPQAAIEFANMGILPEGMYRNRQYAQEYVDVGNIPLALQDTLFDPQTSGGLLISVHPDDANRLLDHIPAARLIGRVRRQQGDKFICLK